MSIDYDVNWGTLKDIVNCKDDIESLKTIVSFCFN